MKNLFFRFTSFIVNIIALTVFAFSVNVQAQNYIEKYSSNGEHLRIDRPNNGVSTIETQNGKVTSVNKENPDEVVSIIVTFKDQPLAAYQVKKQALQKVSIATVYSALQSRHFSFRTALSSVSQQLSNRFKSDYGYTVTRDYYRALNGVAMQCKRGMIGTISSLPMVEYISIDREVKANLEQSVHQIRADIVQDSLGITGKGVLVGDVDTGIDYNNPALGGGFGPAFRIIGGHNFANNNNNPMDDHGHGTHVAGIIGANGGDSLRGVAPDVKFLAVKVLDASGSGWISNVIAGIDYCLDPDNNPETNDGVNIINMSLGGAPYPGNPLDSAVNNANKAGILSIVAAGNNSHGAYWWGTINSPGTCETALTVGACDSTFNIAWFSSAGPDPIHSAIKPEVLAPGVNILSTVLNDQTASWSGTSMATPHVTGVAALLKQEHPSWTPEELKAAIVNTAHSVGENVSLFVQGKGCVDALDAAEAKTLVEPGVLSFGVVDLAQDVWADTIEIKVKNIYTKTQNEEIRIKDGIPSGATLTFDKTTFTLAPGEETTVAAILSVPSSVPIISTEPFAYLGSIEVVSESDTVNVPLCFFKSSTIVVNFEIQPEFLWVINRQNGVIKGVSSYEGVTQYKVPVSSVNSLEILAGMRQDTLGVTNYYIVNRKIDDPTGLTYVFLSSKEATISMTDSTILDDNNNIVTIDSTSYINLIFELAISIGNNSSSSSYTWGFPYDRFRILTCPLDSTYYIYKWMVTPHGNDYFDLKKSFWGINNQRAINFPTGKDNLHGYNVALSYDNPYLNSLSNTEKFIAIGTYDISENYTRTNYGYGIAIDASRGGSSYPIASNNIKVIYNDYDINPPKVENSGVYHYSYRNIFLMYRLTVFDGPPEFPPLFTSSNFVVMKNGEAIFGEVPTIGYANPPTIDFSPLYNYEVLEPGDTIKLQQYNQVCYPLYISYLNNGSLFISPNDKLWYSDAKITDGIGRTNGTFEWIDKHFSKSWNKPRFNTQAYVDNRNQVDTEPVYSGYDKIYYKYDGLKNNIIHVLTSGHPYSILDQSGQTTIDCEYQIPVNSTDTTYYPSINLIQVSVNGKAVDVVHPDQSGIVRLVLDNRDNSIVSVNLSLLLPSGEEVVLPITKINSREYDAIIPNYIPSGFIDAVASIEDAKGNISELNASPAFYFGNAGDNIKLDARLRMASYALNNVDNVNFNIGDTLNYFLSYTNFGSNIARNIVVSFPTTPYLRPIGSTSWTIDSLAVNDTVQVPVRLVFLGKQQSTDAYTHYTSSITWTSGVTTYLRKHNVLVDFQNTIVGVAQTKNMLPETYELYQNYPNPFNPSTTIKYDLPKQSRVKLVVFDLLGREVATLVDEMRSAGSYQAVWNAIRYASGVYFYRLDAGAYHAVKKLLLLK